MPPETPPGSPTILGKYELLVELTGSGVASTWVARRDDDTSEKPQLFSVLRLHRHVTKNIDLAEAFVKDARLAQKLKHPNVLELLETGISDGEVFVVAEYTEGETLAALTTQAGPPGIPQGAANRIGLDVLS